MVDLQHQRLGIYLFPEARGVVRSVCLVECAR